MKAWRWLLLLIIAAVLGAALWTWLAADPGYVLIRIRGWRIEATVIGAVLVLIALWLAVAILWWLLRWPFGALSRRHRRLSRQRLSEGLIALAEGRHSEAERVLQRAAQHAPLRAPALLAAAEAAHRRGENARALEALDEATQYAPQAARVQRARMLRRDGRAEEALALLNADADAGRLPPSGWRELAKAALASGRYARARAALEPLRKSNMLGARGFAHLETRVLTASLRHTADRAELDALWSGLGRAQRALPKVIEAYAQRAAGLGATLAAMDEIETALKREWSPPLVAAYGRLDGGDAPTRLNTAEGWLPAHPNDTALLVALGRLALRAQQPQRARDYLERALALEPSAAGWEALGDTQAALGAQAEAARCYANALKCARGESTIAPAPRAGALDTRPIAVEERDEHGVPRLPG